MAFVFFDTHINCETAHVAFLALTHTKLTLRNHACALRRALVIYR